MNVKVNLKDHLPPFLAEYKELSRLFSAEDPEFDLLWNEAQNVLNDQYIETASERGVIRLEKITGIPADRSLTLAERKTRIITRINEELPYTLRKLNELLSAVCGNGNFSIFGDFPNYTISVTTERLSASQIIEVERLLDNVIPANLVMFTQNREDVEANGGVYLGGAVTKSVTVECSSDLDENKVIVTNINIAACISDHKCVVIDTA